MTTRGMGQVFRDVYRHRGELRTCKTWSIRFWDGDKHKQRTESSHSTDKRVAQALLTKRLHEVNEGSYTEPDRHKVTFADLAQALIVDYKIEGNKSLDRLHYALHHLHAKFGEDKVSAITPGRVADYIVTRQESGAANATINRELAALRRMFSLGRDQERIVGGPKIKLLKENNTRTGFFERSQFEAVRRHLPRNCNP